MNMTNSRKVNKIMKIVPFIIVFGNFIIFFFSWLLLADNTFINNLRYISYVSIMLIYVFVNIILNNLYDGYAFDRRRISENVYSLSLSCIISLFLYYFLDTLAFREFDSVLYLIVSFVFQVLNNIFICKIANNYYFNNCKQKRTLIICKNEKELSKRNNIPFFDLKYKIEEVIINPSSYKSISKQIVNVDTIFIFGVNATIRNGVAKDCISNGIELFVVPHVGDIIITGAEYVQELSIPMLLMKRKSKSSFYFVLKRLFDIFISVTSIVILSPLMIIVSLFIKLYDNGPIIYKQIRLTKDRKEFYIYKFRSMRVDAEKDGIARLVSENDNRITPIGKVIRSIRVDELPQLLNILKGDMTIVGPRPERPEIAAQYEKRYPSFSLRLQVKAGLTGYAQIYGKYNTEPIDKLKMDLLYINKMSFMFDLKMCFMTIKTLFMKDSTQAIEEGQRIA